MNFDDKDNAPLYTDSHLMRMLKQIKVQFHNWVKQFLEPNGPAMSVLNQTSWHKPEKLVAGWTAAFNMSARTNRLQYEANLQSGDLFQMGVDPELGFNPDHSVLAH